MKQNFKRKLLAGILSACMIFQTVGMAPVYAGENADLTKCIGEENAVQKVQALIDALPTLEAVKEITDKDEQKAIYDDLQTAYEAYEALTKEEQGEVTGAEVFEPLFAVFNGMVNLLETAELAVEETPYIKIGGEYLNSGTYYKVNENVVTATGASDANYNIYYSNGTLTLNSLNLTYAGDASAISISAKNSVTMPDITINLIGENMVTGARNDSSAYNSCGVYLNALYATNTPTFTFSGSGSLSAVGHYTGVYCEKGNLKFEGANVMATGNTHGGIFTSSGSIAILSGSQVQANATSTVGECGIGTNVGGVEIDNSTVTVTMDGSGNMMGIQAGAGSAVAIKNKSTVEILEKSGTGYTRGIYCDQIQIVDSALTIKNSNRGISNGGANTAVTVSNHANVNVTVRDTNDRAYYTVDADSSVWHQKDTAVTVYGSCTPPDGMEKISGELTISAGSKLIIGADRTFAITTGTLSNLGTIDNQGTLNLSGYISTGLTGTVENSGTLNLTNTTNTVKNKATINNTGILNAAYGIINDGGTISGTGTVNAAIATTVSESGEGFNRTTYPYTAYGDAAYGGNLRLGESSWGSSTINYSKYTVTVPSGTSFTVPADKTLDATQDGVMAENLSDWLQVSGSLIINGTLLLPAGTTSEQIKALKLNGNGAIKVALGTTPETYATYTKDGTRLHVSTTPMDFTNVTEDKGNLENDGYEWKAETNTLTLQNLNITVSGLFVHPITLPDADCKLILKGTNTLKNTTPESYSIAIYAKGSFTISGDGALTADNRVSAKKSLTIQSGEVIVNESIGAGNDLVISGGTVTANTNRGSALNAQNVTISDGTVTAISKNVNGINAAGTLTISGGSVTASGIYKADQYACGLAAKGEITISGGSVTAKGGRIAIWSGTGITLTGMGISKPNGAVIGVSVKDPDGKAILVNGVDAKEVTIEKVTTPTLTVDNITKTYDGVAVTSVIGTAKVDGTIVPGTFAFDVDTPELKKAGTYTVTVKFTPTNLTGYTEASTDITVTIHKAAATVKADDKSVVFGGAKPEYTATTTGLVNGETISGVTFTDNTVDTNTKGSYTITPSGGTISGGGNDNYVLTYENGVLIVNIDVSVIDTAITTANTAKTGIAIYDSSASSVASGTKFVTTAEMNALNTAIQTAADAKATVSSLTEVQEAAAALDKAVETFKAAIKTGTYTAPSDGVSSIIGTVTPVTPANDAAPFIEGKDGQKGWEAVTSDITDTFNALSNQSKPLAVTVDMNGATELPSDIISLIAGKNIDLTLDMGDGISWTVNGNTVTGENFSDIDLNVTKNAHKIPEDIVNQVSGENYSMQIELSHDGAFGFTATLNINLEKANAGSYANLFYYNEETGKLEYMGSSQIDEDGNAALDFVHASAYTIVVSAEPMSADSVADVDTDDSKDTSGTTDEGTSKEETVEATNESSGNMLVFIVLGIVVVIAIGGGLYLVKRKKDAEE